MKKLVLSMMLAGLIAGCSSFPENYEKPITSTDVTAQMRDSWESTPAFTFLKSNTGKVTRKYATIPKAVSEKPVKLAFDKFSPVTLGDVIFAMRAQGLKVISRMTVESAALAWEDYDYAGTLGDLMQEIADRHNLGLEYRRGNVYLTEANQYSAAMPQHKEFLEQVEAALKIKGATGISSDLQAGMIHYSAKPDDADQLEEYLDKVTKNSAMVSLQVAVLTVGMNRDVNLGIDWATLGAKTALGDQRANLGIGQKTTTTTKTNTSSKSGSNSTSGSTDTSGSTGSSNTSTGSTSTELADHVLGTLLSFTGGSGAGIQFGTNAFSLSAAVKALSTYGNARTEQNVILETLSGVPVELSSGNDIPYVKSIGSSTTSGGSVSGNSQTEIIKSGLLVDVTPRFDAADGTVSNEVKVELSSLVGFRELSAGVNLGTLSQPEMQNLKFKNVARILAGETVVLGGVTYDQINNNYNNLPGWETLPTGSKAEKVNRNAIYILIRPTVTIFTPYAAELNAEMAKQRLDKTAADPSKKSAIPAGLTTVGGGPTPAGLAIQETKRQAVPVPAAAPTPAQATQLKPAGADDQLGGGVDE
ncbi:type II secretion system protein GspD [Comamonas thiooxydans]|uniref:type II secretion system protein GspD n=1 Tax=Comamonas thiooxydans TaxID=363952 RepID=UPI000B41E26C|nr:hypothetical protein [Comamonas thiooxydans]